MQWPVFQCVAQKCTLVNQCNAGALKRQGHALLVHLHTWLIPLPHPPHLHSQAASRDLALLQLQAGGLVQVHLQPTGYPDSAWEERQVCTHPGRLWPVQKCRNSVTAGCSLGLEQACTLQCVLVNMSVDASTPPSLSSSPSSFHTVLPLIALPLQHPQQSPGFA